MKTKEIDMTEGSLWKKIFAFSVPLVFTNLLQILFNMADSAVVGRFAGSLPLGSVGSTGQMIFFCSGLLIGLGSGVNVLVAFSIGKKDSKDVAETVRASFVSCLAAGFLIFAFAWISAPFVLKLLDTKPELFDDALLYFRIYMISMPAMSLYYFGNGVLSAYGDTRSPMFYLAIAGAVNIILDCVLVIVFKMSVAGVGIATVVAQYISCVLTLLKLAKTLDSGRLNDSENSFDSAGIRESDRIRKPKPGLITRFGKNPFKSFNKYKIYQILKIGVPAGLQNSVFAVANMFIVAAVNSFDAEMVAGNAATMNGDNLVYNIMAAFYTAGATFIGQNFGARKKDRILKSYLVTLAYSCVIGFSLGIILYVFGHEFLSLFTKDKIVVDYAMQKFKIMTFSFGISAFMDATIAANRGLGKTLVPSLMVFLGSCVLRIVWVYTIFAHFRTVESLFLLYPFSWAVTAVFETIYFAFVYKKETRGFYRNSAL